MFGTSFALPAAVSTAAASDRNFSNWGLTFSSSVTAVSVKSNITIAGQSAPGGGIGFRGGEISFASQSNIIARYLRIRPGSETASTTDDALSLFRAKTVMIDHASFEFAPWNNIDGVSDDWQNFPVLTTALAGSATKVFGTFRPMRPKYASTSS